MQKMSKSWKLTLATIIIAIVMTILPSLGIVSVTEHQIETLIYLALGVSGIGAANKVGKKLVRPKTVEEKLSSKPRVVLLRTVPKFGPVGAKFQTNFVRTESGNSLPFGNHLWVKIAGVRSYVTAILKDSNGNICQIDQSHELDEDNNIETTRLEMYGKDGNPLPRGKYILEIKGDSGSSDSIGTTDEFSII